MSSYFDTCSSPIVARKFLCLATNEVSSRPSQKEVNTRFAVQVNCSVTIQSNDRLMQSAASIVVLSGPLTDASLCKVFSDTIPMLLKLNETILNRSSNTISIDFNYISLDNFPQSPPHLAFSRTWTLTFISNSTAQEQIRSRTKGHQSAATTLNQISCFCNENMENQSSVRLSPFSSEIEL